ncbi:WD40 repeat-like protein [Massarina eburnea CBS 473.64]|uniref:WD40 repeat-like protein n=1 Tax=Massarina eburnea CBS 473.64 TaxID=1395130 RepID=A0A6A6S5I4_9PLEO|nr:WD40 repeat-like protein [Massarina eburnea CBS 473.64]
MRNTVYDRLLRREVAADRKRYSGVAGMYGDQRWVKDLDIVNELEGHSGCVNALSWSRSGRLLASGSDDHRINIHSYHPESSTSQFNLTTSIVTGHASNIFSVKFMPYSNDRTIVSATDDVRIFDIEHSGHSALNGTSSRREPGARYRVGIHGIPDGLTLTQGDTNAKAFKCHTDTVKRIVTEDNPFFFLTCSEDGDVRQWDIRQPAKTYPPPRDGMPRWAADSDASDNVPAPLISYSKYRLDLTTVSCSPSQPHYIALGGAHLHCFLHDRRMLGRDRLNERGAKLASPGNWSESDENTFGKATQCVKKFAKNGKQRMRRADNGHITACKISDANPNELVVSWSGDHIYSFDILRSPDASEEYVEPKATGSSSGRRVRDNNRKRKRPKSSSAPQEHADRASRQRTESSDEGLALRVNYGNGQSEEIRIQAPQSPLSPAEAEAIQNTDHYRIAKFTVRLQNIFQLSGSDPSGEAGSPSAYTSQFNSLIGDAASILPDMDEISRSWRYPVDPTPVDVALQNKLREGRSSYRRFVQAAGTLARVLGGQLRAGGNSDSLISQYFVCIQPTPNERVLPRNEQFGYDFLKAILLWLDSGLGALIGGFSSSSCSSRLPIPLNADIDTIDEILIPYLLQLASDDPVVDVDANRFEADETRILYSSQKAAVAAFSQALKIPFADLTGGDATSNDSDEDHKVQDRAVAIERWAFKIGRGVLLNASKGVRFSAVDRAFGGRGKSDSIIQAEEAEHRRRQEDIDPLEDDGALEDEALVDEAWARHTSIQSEAASSSRTTAERASSEPPLLDSDINVEEDDEEADSDEDSDGDTYAYDPVDDDEDADSDVDEDGLARTRSGRILWRSDFDRNHLRERVESDVPCAPHTRVYRGHCNIRTVKDVNFFGQQDEYVVSGSDCGHVFIWDKKTAQLVNILEGDGEIVNVIQGHPYEPTMAVSGIDHTIKIFSPDATEQRNARKGVGVQSAHPGFSSIHLTRRRPQRSAEPPETSSAREASSDNEDDEVEGNGLRSRKAMHRAYEITSENDMNRKGGDEEAFITRALLAQLSQRAHAHRQAMGAGDGDDGDDGATVLLNSEDCTVM